MGVPTHLHSSKILLVSFGGQSIPRPRTRPPTPLSTPLMRSSSASSYISSSSSSTLAPPPATSEEEGAAGLLPKGWIAIVCGLGSGNEIRNDLPEGFYAPDGKKDANVPDLTAVADVLLGKLVSFLLGFSFSFERIRVAAMRVKAAELWNDELTYHCGGIRVTALARKRSLPKLPSSTVRFLLLSPFRSLLSLTRLLPLLSPHTHSPPPPLHRRIRSPPPNVTPDLPPSALALAGRFRTRSLGASYPRSVAAR